MDVLLCARAEESQGPEEQFCAETLDEIEAFFHSPNVPDFSDVPDDHEFDPGVLCAIGLLRTMKAFVETYESEINERAGL